MPKLYISVATKEKVQERAKGRCEYCKSLQKYSPQPFHIEHIKPRALGGTTILKNLALSCGGCNNIKYTKVKGIDPITGNETVLFNPRLDKWLKHFKWSADYLSVIGVTSVGRTTVVALRLNREELMNLRKLTKITDEHPPK